MSGTKRGLAMLAAMALVGGQAVAQLTPRPTPAPSIMLYPTPSA